MGTVADAKSMGSLGGASVAASEAAPSSARALLSHHHKRGIFQEGGVAKADRASPFSALAMQQYSSPTALQLQLPPGCKRDGNGAEDGGHDDPMYSSRMRNSSSPFAAGTRGGGGGGGHGGLVRGGTRGGGGGGDSGGQRQRDESAKARDPSWYAWGFWSRNPLAEDPSEKQDASA